MIIVVVATFIAFVVLRLCGVIGWSWWWISAPLWGFILLTLLALGFLALCLVILSYAAKHRKK